tara:strand:- start:9809 stop:11380 length:1572 start_codon:yes stop_codon:yes gene_type:complete
MSELKTEKNFSNIQLAVFLGILVTISIIIKISAFPFGLPIYQDGEVYFWYANDMSILKDFPVWEKHTFPNTLWPTILSGFFSLISSDNFIDYMSLQRFLSLSLSSITAIPIFFLCKKFVDTPYAIIASCLFLFEPRLIQNSLGGLAEPLFLLLGSISILLFLNKKMIWVIVSFVILALFVLTRYEGLVMIIPFSIMFFWRFRNKKYLIHYFTGIAIFLIIIFSMDSLENRTFENSTFGHLGATGNYFNKNIEPQEQCEVNDETVNCISENSRTINEIFFNSIFNIVKYYGWLTIPLFFIFLPLGLYQFFKNRNFEKWTVFLCAIFMLLPVFYAFVRDFEEMKYFYIQIPLLCIVTALAIEFIIKKIYKLKILIVVFCFGIILVGGIFYFEQISMDNHLEREYFEIAKKINSTMKVTNDVFPADKFIRSAKIAELTEFPVLRNSFDLFSLKVVSIHEKDTLNEFLEYAKENNLEYLVIDNDGDGVEFLYEIFHNETDFKFLEKIYDSKNDGYNYHVKFFRINYN